MKPRKSDSLNRPFEALKDLLRAPGVLRECAVPRPMEPHPPPDAVVDDEVLFSEAMAGVRQARWNGPAEKGPKPAAPAKEPLAGRNEAQALRHLVDTGRGFCVADTPEYMEGFDGVAPPEITRRLHRGDFAVQAHLDLHGYNAAAAQDAFDAFMREAVASGKRAVLIIHGRGLSSPAQPVLKTRVAEWLSTGYWRKWVIAYASARWCDGGSGASYVLLRRKPAPKRLRRRFQARPSVGR